MTRHETGRRVRRSATLVAGALCGLLVACGNDGGGAGVDAVGGDDTSAQLGDAAQGDTTAIADANAPDASAPDVGAPDAAPGEKTSWFSTCGDPVCSGWKSKPKVPLCTTQTQGDPCGSQGAQCDPKDGCNAILVCAEKDPKQGPGGCPISARRFKTGIAYLDEAQEAALRDQLLHLPLATWRYKQGTGARRLGYILDDAPALPATDLKRERVDVYSLATMAVAAVKAQQRELRALREELARVKAACRPSAGGR